MSNVISLESQRPEPEPEPVGFAQARDAWLSRWQSDRRLTHSERVICSRMHQYFNREHFERTAGDLQAWPSWQTLMDETGLSKSSVFRRLRHLERLGAFEVEHGRYNDEKKKRAGNRYLVRKSKVARVQPRKADQGCKRVPDQGCTAATRLNERDSVNLKKEEDSKIGHPRGPTAPEKESKQSSTDSPKPSNLKSCDVPRGGGETDAERKARWEREGKSAFTGCPIWKRSAAVNGGGSMTAVSS